MIDPILSVYSVVDVQVIERDAATIVDTIWNTKLLPEIVRHVVSVELLESGEQVQRFRMVLRSGAQSFSTESVRRRNGNAEITYVQTIPPQVLRSHEGTWTFTPLGPDRTEIRLEHRYTIDLDVAARVLAAERSRVPEIVAARIRENGAATLEGYRRYLEGVVA